MDSISVRIADEHKNDVQRLEWKELVGGTALLKLGNEFIHALRAEGHVLHAQALTVGVRRRWRSGFDQMQDAGLVQIEPCARYGEAYASACSPARVTSSTDGGDNRVLPRPRLMICSPTRAASCHAECKLWVEARLGSTLTTTWSYSRSKFDSRHA